MSRLYENRRYDRRKRLKPGDGRFHLSRENSKGDRKRRRNLFIQLNRLNLSEADRVEWTRRITEAVKKRVGITLPQRGKRTRS